MTYNMVIKKDYCMTMHRTLNGDQPHLQFTHTKKNTYLVQPLIIDVQPNALQDGNYILPAWGLIPPKDR